MTRFRTLALVAAGMVTVASSYVAAQTQTDRTVEQYVCKDILRDGGSSRDVAIAFLHGYLLGKSGTSRFNLDVLARQTDDFIERCLNNPNEKAKEAMAAVEK